MATFSLVRVSSALNALKRRDPWYGCDYTLNPYRGCEFSCIYCYSLASRWKARYGDVRGKSQSLDVFFRESREEGQDVEKSSGPKVFVKTNITAVLRREICWKKRGVVFIGSITEPYQPCETRFRLTERCLRILHEQGWPIEIGTKGDLILRDADLLANISSEGFCYVFITITTLDRGLANWLEPRAPSPEKRLDVVERLSELGIPVCVCMIPVFPGLTDGEEAISEVAEAARACGAKRFLAGALTLPGEVRTRFFSFLSARFPELVPIYERVYGPSGYPDRAYERSLTRKVETVRKRVGLAGELAPTR